MQRSSVWRWLRLAIATAGLAGGGVYAASPADRLVVHEWGTFTSLQDESGQALAGVNIDDEPLPAFVHDLSPYVLAPPVSHWVRMKGAPQRHPYVTMRLETPVIYFHPPAAGALPERVDVRASFQGGWLTEFYPWAEAEAPGLNEGKFAYGAITPDTVGRLTWKGLRVGAPFAGPATDEHVWLAPRRVDAAAVATPSGENERYLFYRGVARLDAPLRVTTDVPAGQIAIRGQLADDLVTGVGVQIPALWLVNVRRDGSTAWRRLPACKVTADAERLLGVASTRFDEADYAPNRLGALRAEMHTELVAAGLFADEAEALLETWRRAYFGSHGSRLFFLVPRVWTDRYLPLEISQPASIERVMMGRIELVSDEQRELLARLAAGPTGDSSWLAAIPDSAAARSFWAGRSDFGDLGVAIPPDFQAYLDLGRFRNALIVAEEQRRPTRALAAFIEQYALQQFRPGEE